MQRLLDIILSAIGLVLTAPLMTIIAILGLFDTGSPLFFQQRMGRHQKPFTLVKFRTMNKGTKSVATHLASPASVTKLGTFLRKTKLDELPQLWNVLKGEMSLVGPRPCLPTQVELIQERADLGVFNLRPGITGPAQVLGIDMSTPKLLAKTDAQLLSNYSIGFYFRYIALTVLGHGAGDRINRTGH